MGWGGLTRTRGNNPGIESFGGEWIEVLIVRHGVGWCRRGGDG